MGYTCIQAHFYLHREQITILYCINKEKPQLECDGKCELGKRLSESKKQQENREEISLEELSLVYVPERSVPMVVYSESVSENGEKNSRILSKDMTTGEIIQLSAAGSKVSSPISLATDSGMVITGWLDHSEEIQKARMTFLSPVIPH